MFNVGNQSFVITPQGTRGSRPDAVARRRSRRTPCSLTSRHDSYNSCFPRCSCRNTCDSRTQRQGSWASHTGSAECVHSQRRRSCRWHHCCAFSPTTPAPTPVKTPPPAGPSAAAATSAAISASTSARAPGSASRVRRCGGVMRNDSGMRAQRHARAGNARARNARHWSPTSSS